MENDGVWECDMIDSGYDAGGEWYSAPDVQCESRIGAARYSTLSEDAILIGGVLAIAAGMVWAVAYLAQRAGPPW